MSSKKPAPEPIAALQTIDPTALAQVSGGAGTSSTDQAVMTALTGVLDSLKSLATQNQGGGFGPTEMMMFMMMMQGRGGSGAQVVAPQPNNWTYNADGGYWIVK